MTTYTGIADANGDFTVSFDSASYTSGEKITVTAEKDSATKSIELYAPSGAVGGDAPFQLQNPVAGGFEDCKIKFPGNLPAYAFYVSESTAVFTKVKTLEIKEVTGLTAGNFQGWSSLRNVLLPNSITSISGSACFSGCNIDELTISSSVNVYSASLILNNVSGSSNAFNNVKTFNFLAQVATIPSNAFKQNASTWSSLEYLTLSASLTNIPSGAFMRCPNLKVITMLSENPPTIASNTFTFGTTGNPDTNAGIPVGCIIKVPAASVAAYQAAPNWSAFASQIQAI
ncbi:leucine-rich repeat domain-containing protein [Acinetobacter sp. 197]|uniref:leucine-rich repeat domain-containing protein n=1 Tax=Acinetobacter sp. 197 TaxID=3114696 RepID=UPI003A85B0ED